MSSDQGGTRSGPNRLTVDELRTNGALEPIAEPVPPPPRSVTPAPIGQRPVDILVITALKDELRELREVDDGATDAWQSKEDTSGYTYHVRTFRHHDGSPVRIAAARAVDQGGDFAAVVATGLVRDLRPRCLAMSGICAGRRGKVFLGDVIVADVVFQYDVGKLKAYLDDTGERVEEVLPELRAYNLWPRWKRASEDFPAALVKAIGATRPPTYDAQERWVLETLADQERGGPVPRDHPRRKDSCPDWKAVLDRLRRKSLVYQRMPLRLTKKGREWVEKERHDYPDGHPDPPFQVHVGGLATGDKVIVDEEAFIRLEKVNRSVLGLEREGAAIGLVATLEDVPRMIIAKGVQDYADREKDDSMRHFAARASAEFLLAFLRRHMPPRGNQPTAIEPARVEQELVELRSDGKRQDPPDLEALLDTAYRQKAELEALGKDTTFVVNEIRGLLRQQREGPSLQPGETLLNGRFELREPIGQGGFARVWKAYDTSSRSLVAVKVLHGQYAEDRSRRERFLRGARQMAKLRHPGIVRVIESHCEDRGHLFFVMEYLSGGDLGDAVRQGQLFEDEWMTVVLSVGEALAHAHERGVIHRDVKPGNVLLDAEGKARLTDFDLVRAQDTSGGTRTGMLGTVLYAAPEAMRSAKEVDASVDVYGLGMTAVFVLHGKDLPLEVLRDAPGFVSRLAAKKSVKDVLAKAVAWEAEKRPGSVEDFCHELRESLTEKKAPTRRAETVRSPRSAPPVEDLFRWVDTQHDGRVRLWREIPAGSFQMGSPEGEGRANDEPRHRVEIEKPFYMSAVPVTRAQFAMFERKGTPDEERGHHPVVNVRWHRAMEFCQWLSESFSWARGARLPTEAEWEYACRAGSETRYWSGDDEEDLARVGWYIGNSDNRTHRVGEKPANAWGLYDVHGNVREWTLSPWPSNYASHKKGRKIDPSAIDPADFAANPRVGRVMRGGSYWLLAQDCRSAFRNTWGPGDLFWSLGFRVLLSSAPSRP